MTILTVKVFLNLKMIAMKKLRKSTSPPLEKRPTHFLLYIGFPLQRSKIKFTPAPSLN